MSKHAAVETYTHLCTDSQSRALLPASPLVLGLCARVRVLGCVGKRDLPMYTSEQPAGHLQSIQYKALLGTCPGADPELWVESANECGLVFSP